MITSFFSGILGILLFYISLRTIKERRTKKVSLGLGNNNEVSAIVSAHSNFVSYTPLFLILMYLVELSDHYSSALIYAGGIAFTLGRIFHFVAFAGDKMNFKYRVLGMHLTLWPLLVFSILSLVLNFLS